LGLGVDVGSTWWPPTTTSDPISFTPALWEEALNELKRYRNLVYDNARWARFQFRDGDIVISTPPKCGTTWMQTLCAMLVLNAVEFDRPLTQISPWLDVQINPLAAVLHDLEAQEHRRLIKTHTPLDGLPSDERATYVCVGRDPRDVALSFEHHLANLDMEAFMAARAAAVGLADLAELGPPPPSPSPDPAERFWAWAYATAGSAKGPTLSEVLSQSSAAGKPARTSGGPFLRFTVSSTGRRVLAFGMHLALPTR
jgi:hypothetical protein